MPARLPAFLLVVAILAIGPAARAQKQQPDLRIAGPVSTKPLLLGVIRAMKQDKSLVVAGQETLTSADAIDDLAQHKADIAFITRPLTGEERAQYPDLSLFVVPIGMQAVALGISDDLWNAGLHSITKESMHDIYEQKITNWRQAGGPDEKITFFNIQQGLGVWEIFAEWLYGDNRQAPLPKFQQVASSEDARDALEFTPGAIAPLAAPLADGARCHFLAIDLHGSITKPAAADVASGTYPIVQPLAAVVVGRPTLNIRVVTEYLTGPDGQALVKKCDYLGLDAVPKPSP